jgi:amino acid adenylation domain-containing protein
MSRKFIHKVIEDRVLEFPKLIAAEGYGLSLTYSRLNTAANQLAHLLVRETPGPQAAVGVYAAGGPLQVVHMLAAFKSASVYVPMSPDQAVNRLYQMITENDIQLVVTTTEHYLSLSHLLQKQATSVKKVIIADITGDALVLRISGTDDSAPETIALQDMPDTSNPDVSEDPTAAAYVFYTSGSTGTSKGIVGSHQALSHYIHWHMKEWSVDSSFRISQLAPMTFDASLKDILTALASGAKVCMPDAVIKNNSSLLVEWLRNEHVTMLQTVPSLFRLITDALEESGKGLPELHYVVLAGERLYGRDVTRWKAVNGTAARLSNLYGLTETTILKTCYHITTWDWPAGEVMPVGFPISQTLVAVINSSNNICEDGEIGEIYIKSPYISKGYLNTALNAQYLVQNPLVKDSKDLVWKTGDLGRYRPDNSLEVLGRNDEQVKINGVRIELSQITAAVMSQEGITRTELVIHSSEDLRQELICYFTGKRYMPEELRRLLSVDLNPAMLPGFYVWLDAFPLNMNGKVDRKALPKPEEILSRLGYSAPRPGTEKTLAQIWQQMLGVNRVSRDDNFFNIGGSSLKAIQVIARIYKELDVQLTINALFTNPVLSQLAEVISQSRRHAYEPIPQYPAQEDYVLSNSQRRLWLLSQLEDQSVAYNIPVLYRLSGRLNTAALTKAFTQLVFRHESLRTVFTLVDGEPRQRIQSMEEAGEALNIIDYRHEAAPENAAKEFADELFAQPFNLQHGPLMKAALLQIADDDFLLACSVHHIIFDDWSLQVMGGEIIEMYNAFSAEQPLKLQPLNIQYRDFATWQQQQMAGELFTTHRQYWMSRFAGELPVLDLPADFSRPAIRQHKGAQYKFSFSAEQSAAFHQLLQKQQVTQFMGLTALVNVLLFRYSGQDDLIVGTPVAGREHPDLEGQIGYYLNTLALRNRLTGDEGFVQLLEHVRQTTVDAFSHQSYPFDLLVEELGIGGDLSRSPLFDVVIILQNVEVLNEEQIQMNDVKIEIEPAGLSISKSDLRFQFSVLKSTGEIYANIEYNTDLFNAQRIERMSRHLIQLMESVTSDARAPIGTLEYLSPGEKRHEREIVRLFNSNIEETF